MNRLVCVLMILLPLFGFAGPEGNKKEEKQPTTFQGTIGDVSNYQPLSDVQLTITSGNTGLKKVVKTDDQGRFLVTDLPAGIYQVKFQKGGYEPGTYQSLTLHDGTINSFGFLLFEE